jgi:hypothetical protein
MFKGRDSVNAEWKGSFNKILHLEKLKKGHSFLKEEKQYGFKSGTISKATTKIIAAADTIDEIVAGAYSTIGGAYQGRIRRKSCVGNRG